MHLPHQHNTRIQIKAAVLSTVAWCTLTTVFRYP
jgi:hypothetical protein